MCSLRRCDLGSAKRSPRAAVMPIPGRRSLDPGLFIVHSKIFLSYGVAASAPSICRAGIASRGIRALPSAEEGMDYFPQRQTDGLPRQGRSQNITGANVSFWISDDRKSTIIAKLVVCAEAAALAAEWDCPRPRADWQRRGNFDFNRGGKAISDFRGSQVEIRICVDTGDYGTRGWRSAAGETRLCWAYGRRERPR